jgi:hypothetical protein
MEPESNDDALQSAIQANIVDDPELRLDSPYVVSTKYWHQLEDGRIQCDVCPRFCKLRAGQGGFCLVRASVDDQIVLTTGPDNVLPRLRPGADRASQLRHHGLESDRSGDLFPLWHALRRNLRTGVRHLGQSPSSGTFA